MKKLFLLPLLCINAIALTSCSLFDSTSPNTSKWERIGYVDVFTYLDTQENNEYQYNENIEFSTYYASYKPDTTIFLTYKNDYYRAFILLDLYEIHENRVFLCFNGYDENGEEVIDVYGNERTHAHRFDKTLRSDASPSIEISNPSFSEEDAKNYYYTVGYNLAGQLIDAFTSFLKDKNLPLIV